MPTGILSKQQLNAYKYRIGFNNATNPTLEILKQLHEAHVFTIPFENLTIKANLKISLTLDALYKKIIKNKRGGYCFELNGLFYSLLSTIGFDVYPILAQVHFAKEHPKQTCHRMGVVVINNDQWLVDVGSGHIISPIKIADHSVSIQYSETFRVIKYNDSAHEFILQRYKHHTWFNLYSFSINKIDPKDFAKQIEQWNEYYHSSSLSTFKQNFMCMLPTKDGKIKLSSDGKLLTFEIGAHKSRQVIGKDIRTIDALHNIGVYLTESDIMLLGSH
jgi:Arylamine N-acetyltransferase